MPFDPMPDRTGMGELVWLGLVALFALFGAVSRTLLQWKPGRPPLNALGNLMTSVFAAWLIGLALKHVMAEQPDLLLATTGAAAWFGGDMIDRLARWLLPKLNGNGKSP